MILNVHEEHSTGPRYFDGRLRKPVSHRFVLIAGSTKRLRVEKLECGHEKVYMMSRLSRDGFMHVNSSRVCYECPQWKEPK